MYIGDASYKHCQTILVKTNEIRSQPLNASLMHLQCSHRCNISNDFSSSSILYVLHDARFAFAASENVSHLNFLTLYSDSLKLIHVYASIYTTLYVFSNDDLCA